MTVAEKNPKTISEWLKVEAAPDVLDTIANLSNDEVFTSPAVANQMLDLLPKEVWSNPDLKFLDPCVKTGVFLREIVKRLMHGLEGRIPNARERLEHVLREQVYGIAITELTSLMSRRTVYCASDATREMDPEQPENCFSAVIFDDPDGNIIFPLARHNYAKNDKCTICGAGRDTYQGEDREDRESYAYPFIHMDIEEMFGDMQFDVIIGNPPYQLRDGGHSASASPIYHKFIERAKELDPKYLSMIIPARWYAGGKGLDDFRRGMIADRRISSLVDIPNAGECFPGVEVKGGVCYFLRGKDEVEGCEVRTLRNGSPDGSMVRPLDQYDIVIRYNESVSILEKVMGRSQYFLDDQVSSRKPFGFPTNFSDFSSEHFKGAIEIYARGRKGWIARDKVEVGVELIDKHKVFTSMAYGAGEGTPHQITGQPIIAGPGSCCTETYIVAGSFDDGETAYNYQEYMKTRFFRFMVSLRKNTQHITRDRFRFTPQMDMSKVWTDEELYAHFSLSQDEIGFIEAMIKEMP